MPVQLATSKNMRTVFGDFKQMSRSKFVKKYELKIPPPPPKKKVFPFSKLPRELQELIWDKVSLLPLWSLQHVSKEWREYFQLRTRAGSLDGAGEGSLFPRGPISLSITAGYYPTEFHFFIAHDLLEWKRREASLTQIVNEMRWYGSYHTTSCKRSSKEPEADLPPKLQAMINLLQEDGRSVDFKEKIFFTTSDHVDYYYIQKSEHFGIALQISKLHKLPAYHTAEAKRRPSPGNIAKK